MGNATLTAQVFTAVVSGYSGGKPYSRWSVVTMRYYHPEIQPYHTQHLDVGDGHRLWVAESGNPNGLPVVVIHGGPGTGSSDTDRQLFDPHRYRIIQFDQRGCGESTPHASLEANTPEHLVADMERIREALEIDRWLCFGGSWGSTLALLYGRAYPDRVSGFILRGVFLCRPEDLDWIYNGGAGRVFPEHWEKFSAVVQDERPLLKAYHCHLTGDDELERLRAARAWAAWEGLISTLKPSPKNVARLIQHHSAYAMARLSADYFVTRDRWLTEPLLTAPNILADHPAILLHGRYDMVCPLDNAWALKQQWPLARLEIIRESGHSSRDPAMRDALLKAMEDMAETLGGPVSSA